MPQVNNPKFFRDYRRLFRLLDGGTVFCAYDTETSGLHYKSDKIIELAAVKFDKNGVIGDFSSLVKVHISLPPEVIKMTKITDEMLKDANDAKTVLADFAKFSKKTVLVAHNASFDWHFVNYELISQKMPQLKNLSIDTLDLARWAYPLNKKYALQYLADGMKIKRDAAHRALDDSLVCMEVFLRIIRDTMSIQKLD